ncbi:MAG: hypothetical protein GF331_01675 [Chitinivibrionales bacterium]|nr:hypothetical protein [Chitinivibrionales bacterium]
MKLVQSPKVRVGVVGCGVVSSYGHIPAIYHAPEAQLVAFADPNEQRLRAEMERYDLPGYASIEEMVANEELDAVAVPTQPDIKLDIIKVAAANGLHAFCEKPLTDTVEQARELMQLMDKADLFVGMAFVYRGKNSVQRMVELVDSGAIGELRAVHIENMWDYHGLRDAADRGNRRHRALQNLGTLDCGVHDLDLARYLSRGEYGDIAAIGAIVEHANEYPDHIIMHSRMSNGVLVSVEESAVWGYTAKDRPVYEQSYRLLGENGFLAASFGDWGDGHQSGELRVVSGADSWTETVSSDKAWDSTYRQFFQILLGREPRQRFLADGHDALVNMQIAREVIAQCQK